MSTTTTIHITSPDRHRFHLLDGFRGIAAILILSRHAPPYLASFLSFPNSYLAVDFFFGLSGFVVAFAYEQRLSGSLGLRAFVVTRLIRLYPMYLVATVCGWLYQIAAGHLLSTPTLLHGAIVLPILSSIFLLPNPITAWTVNLFPIDPPAWSLFFELVVNFAFAFLVRKRAAASGILATFAGISLACLILFTRGATTLDLGASWDTFGIGLTRTIFSFITGVLLYRLTLHAGPSRMHGNAALLRAGVTTVLVIAVLTLHTGLTSSSLYRFGVVLVFFPAIIYFGANVALPDRWNRLCAFLGDVSYPLYIAHWPLLAPLAGHGIQGCTARFPILLKLLLPSYIVLLLFVAWVLARFYDAPVRRRLAARYNNRNSRATPIFEAAKPQESGV